MNIFKKTLLKKTYRIEEYAPGRYHLLQRSVWSLWLWMVVSDHYHIGNAKSDMKHCIELDNFKSRVIVEKHI